MTRIKGKREFPNTYIIVFAVIVLCAVATWFVPGGEYISDPSSENSELTYVTVESVPQTWQITSALYKGFTKQAGIIIFILVIGGAFWIVNSTKAIDVGIFSFLNFTKGLERYTLVRKLGVGNIVIVLIMLMFSLFGAIFGMSEETIAFIVIIIPLAISMGYDSITAVCMVYVAAHVGFAGAFLNPFTIGIAQTLADVPLFSGIEFRFVCWLILTAITIIFVLVYANRVKKRPESSIMYSSDEYWREQADKTEGSIAVVKNRSSWVAFGIASAIILLFTLFYYKECVITLGNSEYHTPWMLPVIAICFLGFSLLSLRKSNHFFIFNLLIFTIIYLIIGVLGYSWYITEISALFLTLGILSGISGGYTPNKVVNEFLAGAKDIFSAALIVGLAAGIVIILEEGKIIGTILHSLAGGLGESGQYGAASLMYIIQTTINMLIPSASAKAAITIPIMAPFSDLIGLSRQTMILAFQFGDGFTNMITPTSGVLIAVLGVARIPYTKWVRWAWKFILGLIIVGFILLMTAVAIGF